MYLPTFPFLNPIFCLGICWWYGIIYMKIFKFLLGGYQRDDTDIAFLANKKRYFKAWEF